MEIKFSAHLQHGRVFDEDMKRTNLQAFAVHRFVEFRCGKVAFVPGCASGQRVESYAVLFLRENDRREQNHVDEGNERHCDIVCRQIQWREREATLHLESKVDKQSANYGEDKCKNYGHVVPP